MVKDFIAVIVKEFISFKNWFLQAGIKTVFSHKQYDLLKFCRITTVQWNLNKI